MQVVAVQSIAFHTFVVLVVFGFPNPLPSLAFVI